MIWKVFTNINLKRATLPSMSSARRLHYEGIIYRFKFLMITTLLCASLTVIGFILGQVSDVKISIDGRIIEVARASPILYIGFMKLLRSPKVNGSGTRIWNWK